jgi:hypothetical protein
MAHNGRELTEVKSGLLPTRLNYTIRHSALSIFDVIFQFLNLHRQCRIDNAESRNSIVRQAQRIHP